MLEHKEFGKIARLSREMVITEKIDGTNGLIAIGENGEFEVGSRSRWITPADDNHGFAKWAYEHKNELMTLGTGYHYGEWWGHSIQRGYGLNLKRFSLFNTARWSNDSIRPTCCHVVPVLYSGMFDTTQIDFIMARLIVYGSNAAPGFMKPEGVVIYHTAARMYFKKTFEKDDSGKWNN